MAPHRAAQRAVPQALQPAEAADAEAVAAEYRDGVLVVSVAKRAQAKPRRIDVRAS